MITTSVESIYTALAINRWLIVVGEAPRAHARSYNFIPFAAFYTRTANALYTSRETQARARARSD